MVINSFVFDLLDEKNCMCYFGLLLVMNFLGGFFGVLFFGLFWDVFDLNIVFVLIMIFYFIVFIFILIFLNDNEKKIDKVDEKLCSLF